MNCRKPPHFSLGLQKTLFYVFAAENTDFFPNLLQKAPNLLFGQFKHYYDRWDPVLSTWRHGRELTPCNGATVPNDAPVRSIETGSTQLSPLPRPFLSSLCSPLLTQFFSPDAATPPTVVLLLPSAMVSWSDATSEDSVLNISSSCIGIIKVSWLES